MQDTDGLKERIELLNTALARELQVSIQYMLQHTLFTGGKEPETEESTPKQGAFIGSHSPVWFPGSSLKKIAVAEMKHAEAIAERIVALGEKPTSNPAPITLGDSPREMLEINQKAEAEAIELYQRIIETAGKQGDETTLKMFGHILDDERSHLGIFNGILG